MTLTHTLRRVRPLWIVGPLVLLILVLVASALPADAKGKKEKLYRFEFVNGVVIEGTATSNEEFLADAGGTDPANPTGMIVHVSCSDDFPNGFGEKDGPDPVTDSAWQIASFTISEVKGDEVKVKCGDDLTPEPPMPPTPPAAPAVDIEKYVNGLDADDAPGPLVQVGDTVRISYDVTNTGDIPLDDIVVTDLDLGAVDCPRTELGVGESMSCDEAFVEVTQPGAVFMEARVDAVGKVNAAPTAPQSDEKKEKGYAFTFVNGVTVSGVSTSNEVFLPNAGGTDPANPTGMIVHVSCSDDFPNGFGEKDGPDPVADSAWQIAAFSIVKDKGKKTCGDVFTPAMIPVMDDDPINYVAEDTPPPPPPPGVDCEAVADVDAMTVTIGWEPIDGAKAYAIKRDNRWLTRTTDTTFVDMPPKGEKVEYFLRWIGTDGTKSDYVSCGEAMIPEGPPPVDPPPFCTAELQGNSIVISWGAVDGAKAYQVREDGKWRVRTTETSWTDLSPTLTYTVEAVYAGNVKSTQVACDLFGS